MPIGSPHFIPMPPFVSTVTPDTLSELTNLLFTPVSLTGTPGPDTLYGRWANDTIVGGDGRDTIDGGPGDDLINGDEDVDFIDGGDGNDTISGGGDQDDIYGSLGNDFINGGESGDFINGGPGDDILYGGGDAADDYIVGGAGDDFIWGGLGWDYHLEGGSGDDTFYISHAEESGIWEQDIIYDFSYNGRYNGDHDKIDLPIAGTSGNFLWASTNAVEMHEAFPEANQNYSNQGLTYLYLANADPVENRGFLLGDLDGNGSFETGIELRGAGQWGNFNYDAII
jgi:Ca2+-binding RTX toxin-like protein